MKRLLLLGGSRYLLPVIREARELGYYVITCDYLPDNIAHRYSDEYHNVSIIDKEAVLELAARLKVDGIMSFATDPGVLTAAYVSEKLGLPTPPYQSVEILQNKDKFRAFLAENNFNVPKAHGYDCIEEALKDCDYFNWPVIVKPVDSAGSKGVTKVETPDKLESSLHFALQFSIGKRFIIEEFIEKDYDSSDTDCFSVNNELAFVSFSNQKFDDNAENPYTPAAYSWPSDMPAESQVELQAEIQRLIRLLNMGTSIYNVETRLGQNGKTYIMELSPRGGGNRLSEVLYYATGVNLIRNAVQAAVGESELTVSQQPYKGYWGEYILHSDAEGIFDALVISPELRPFVYETDLWVSKGDTVKRFSGANEAVGTLILRFETKDQQQMLLYNIKNLVKVSVK